ncbi:MAG: carboxypeptidase-like regulatory domain-containing protein [Planctomycetota bacterium]
MSRPVAAAAALAALALVALALLAGGRRGDDGARDVAVAAPPGEAEAIGRSADLAVPAAEPLRTAEGTPPRNGAPEQSAIADGPRVAPAAEVRDATIEGRVVADDPVRLTGEPVEGAEVSCRGVETKTDSEGRFRLRVRSTGYGGVLVRAESYRPGGVTPGAIRAGETTTVEVRLEQELGPEWSVHGYVRTGSGAVVAGARVRCGIADERETRSDAAGFYRLRGLKLDPGVFGEVTAESEGFARASAYAEGVAPPPDGGIELDLILRRGARVAGRVQDAGGEPVAGGSLWIGDHPDLVANLRAATDDQGRFLFEGVRARPTLLGFESPGRPSDARSIAPVDGETLLVAIVLPECEPLTGRVVDGRGTPVERAVVTARRVDSTNHRVGTTRGNAARTNAEGSFTITGVALGSVEVRATEGDHAPAALVVDHPSRDEVVLVLHRRILLRGRVVDGVTGDPVERFQVRLQPPKDLGGEAWFDGIDASWVFGGRPFESVDGRWVTGGEDPFAAGISTLVEVRAEGYETLTLGPVATSVDEEFEHALKPR